MAHGSLVLQAVIPAPERGWIEMVQIIALIAALAAAVRETVLLVLVIYDRAKQNRRS
ncbi:MAG: hypothetical protein LBJ07_02110 [Actinomycetes bacterium]|nr:hypothetical protein [Actinomycetes bacterium]